MTVLLDLIPKFKQQNHLFQRQTLTMHKHKQEMNECDCGCIIFAACINIDVCIQLKCETSHASIQNQAKTLEVVYVMLYENPFRPLDHKCVFH